jgi:hypothetical protein
MFIILCCGLIRPLAAGGDDQPPPNLIRNGDFEQWEWREFSDSQRKAIKAALKSGKKLADLNLEVRGPLFRSLVGYGEVSGRMVEGKEAWQGKSLFLRAEQEELQWGLHWLLRESLRPNATYTCEVVLKGTGKFMLRAWIGGKNVQTGTFQWLGFPDLVTLTPTESWQPYRGTFTVPNLGREEVPQENSAVAIILAPGSKVFLDGFKLVEGTQP